jgi:ankyrin repeat protein
MYEILSNNKSYTSAPRDYKERKDFFDNIAKALSFLTDNFERKYQEKEIDDIQAYSAIECIGDAGKYCAGRWRELIEKLTIQLDAKDQQKLGIKMNPENYLEENLKDIYANARNIEIEKLAKIYSNTFYNFKGISMETHYKSFFKRYLNDNYGLDSTTINGNDPVFSSEALLTMKLNADSFSKSMDIEFLINSRAKKIFEDEDLNKNTKLRDAIYDWGVRKYKTLSDSEKNKYDDSVDYINSNIFDIDDNYVIKGLRKGIVNSLLIDKGFLKKMNKRISENDITDDLLKKMNLNYESEALEILNTAKLGKRNLDKILISATQSGSVKIVAKALEKGANPSSRDEKLRTPLHIATANKNMEMVDILLEYENNPNLKDNKGFTALMIAATQNSHEIAYKLIEKGAKTTSRNLFGHTAIFYAVQNNSTETLIVILDNIKSLNVDFKTEDILGKMNLNYESVALAMLDNAKLEKRNLNKILISATKSGSVKIAAKALEKGANPSSRDEELCTPLHIATLKKNMEMVNILLEYEKNLNLKDNQGSTALIMAAARNCHEIVYKLIEKGAKTTSKNMFGHTALYYAVQNNCTEAVKALLDNRKSLNADEKLSWGKGLKNTLKSINNIGRDLSPNEGNLCFLMAYGFKNSSNLKELLKNNNGKLHISQSLINNTMYEAIKSDNVSLVKSFTESGFDINGISNYGMTPLQYAVKSCCPMVVNYLVENGAKIHNDEKSPLFYFLSTRDPSFMHGQEQIIKTLIDNNANLDCRNKNGDTPLMRAIHVGNYELALQLFHAGANFTLKNNLGISALDLAQKSNNFPLLMAMNEKINRASFNRRELKERDQITNLPQTKTSKNTEMKNRRNSEREFNI